MTVQNDFMKNVMGKLLESVIEDIQKEADSIMNKRSQKEEEKTDKEKMECDCQSCTAKIEYVTMKIAELFDNLNISPYKSKLIIEKYIGLHNLMCDKVPEFSEYKILKLPEEKCKNETEKTENNDKE